MNMSECAKDGVETKGETGKSTAAINKNEESLEQE